ncbi:transcriptional regulator [Streptomyces bobili]|uniref:transcriptional regulator n=1 Tax=Streptomyces bobili TaxID=67280 RepID=UPI00342246F7
MSSVGWEETKRKARERRVAAGLPVRTAEEKQAAMDRLAAEVRAYQLAEARGDQALTQCDVALAMRASPPRVSAIEHGEVDRTVPAAAGTPLRLHLPPPADREEPR